MNPNPVITTGESRMFLALGVQDWFPAVPSASLHRLGFIYAWWGIDSCMGFEYYVVITLASQEFSNTSYDSSNVPAVFCAFLASSGSHSIATPPLFAYLHGLLPCGPFSGF